MEQLEQDLADLEKLNNERTAIMVETFLGNEYFARQLLDVDTSLVEKLLNRIVDVKDTISRMRDPAAKEAFEEVRKAEQMFLDALAEKGMRFEGGKIVGANEEDEVKKSNKKQSGEKSVRDAVDNEGGQEYNRKAITPYADVMAVTKESYEHRAWATNPIQPILFMQETMRFYQQIERMEEGRYSPPKTGDGYYLVEVNPYKISTSTKIVVTDGDTANPSIEAVIDLMTGNAFTTQKVREYIERNTTSQKIDQLPIRIENAFPYEKNVTVWVSTHENGSNFESFESKRNGFVQPQTKYVYTQEQYERFGWAVFGGLIEPGHISDLETKIKVTNPRNKYPVTPSNELIIAVNPLTEKNWSINNTLLFVKGNPTNWEISRIVQVHLYDETSLEVVRKEIANDEARGGKQASELAQDLYGEEFVRRYDKTDWPNYQIYSALVGRGSSRSASGGNHAGSHQRQTAEGDRGQAVGDLPQTGVKKSRKANSQTSGKPSASPSEVSQLTAMQKQTVANYARTKVYTKADSEPLVPLSPRNKKGLPLQSFLLRRTAQTVRKCRQKRKKGVRFSFVYSLREFEYYLFYIIIFIAIEQYFAITISAHIIDFLNNFFIQLC